MKWEVFVAEWNAKVFQLRPNDDEWRVYNEFVQGVNNDALLMQAIDQIGMDYKTGDKYATKPNLSTLKSVYFGLKNQGQQRNGCKYCGGGSFIVIKKYDARRLKWMLYDSRQKKHEKGDYGVFSAPCTCRPVNRIQWEVFSRYVFSIFSGENWSAASAFVNQLNQVGRGGEA